MYMLLDDLLLSVSHLLNQGGVAQVVCLHNGRIQGREVQSSNRHTVIPVDTVDEITRFATTD